MIRKKNKKKAEEQILEGSRAIALTIKNISPDVVSAYPITPQTHIVEDLAKFKADGIADYEYIRAESEFAAASIILGASATGVRTYSATSSQGLLLMAEVLYNISGMRLPIVMTCANRAVSAPINIWCFAKDTKILMADLTYRPIIKIKIGDYILGKNQNGQLVYSKVTKLFTRETDNLINIKSKETEVTCTPEHPFYYHGGHDHYTKAVNLKGKDLHYFGYNQEIDDEFKRGWLAGVADGDGSFGYNNNNKNSQVFRLKCKDEEMATTFILWANHFNFPVRKYSGMEKFGYFTAIMTLTEKVKSLNKFLIKTNNKNFARGYLAGIYDAEGSGPYKIKQATIYNNDKKIIKCVADYLNLLNLNFKVYVDHRRGGLHKNDNFHVKINNVPEFFIKCPPRISRKRDNILKMSLKSVKSRTKIIETTTIIKKMIVYNLETETNNYIANGLLVHNCDHSDAMAMRDAGWIPLFAENHLEAVYQHLLAYKIAEKMSLPIMINVDGFILTHSYESVIIPDKKLIKKFLPNYQPRPNTTLNPENPITLGGFFPPAAYFSTRQQLANNFIDSSKEIKKEYSKLKKIFGFKSNGNGLVEYCGAKKPKTIIIAMGSVTGTIKAAVLKNSNTGLLKITSFRPFPEEEIRQATRSCQNIVIIEKAMSPGNNSPLYTEVRAALMGEKKNISGYVAGLGGQDIKLEMITKILEKAGQVQKKIKFLI